MKPRSVIEETFAAIRQSSSVEEVVRLAGKTFRSSFQNAGREPALQLHPLGFLALTWQVDELRALRLHYWSRSFDWAQSNELQIHDHTFEFRSAVLLGRIRNHIYSIRPSVGEQVLYLTGYTGQKSLLHPQQERVATVLESNRAYEAGSIYRMPAGVLHRTELESDQALTVLATQYASVVRDGARVIGSAHARSAAFSRSTISSDRRRMLIASVAEALVVAAQLEWR